MKGKEAGLREGLQDGIRSGMKEGMKEGIEVAKRKLVINMLQTGQLTESEIATYADVPLTYVEKVKATLQQL